jgi:CheY-like chemotaxis protein
MAAESRTILLVDDDELVTESFATIFRGEGYDVAVARNGLEAVEVATARPFDVILLDVVLPGMDGVTTLECLNKVSAGSRVMVLTGDGETEPQDLLALGASAVIWKPPDIGELLDRVARLSGATAAATVSAE